MKYILKSACLLFLAIVAISCFERELDNDDNYTNLKRSESIKDNEILRFRTFRIDNSRNFLIFGNNNEVSIEGTARLPLYFYIDNGNKIASIDLTGCIYEYTKKTDEVLFRKAILRSKLLKEPLVIDVLFYFAKASKENTKSELFDLKLKQITIDENTLSVGDKVEKNGQTVGFLSEFKYKLVYYRN